VHVVYHDLASSGGKPTLRTVLAVEDSAWLDACRKPMLESPSVDAATLCGRPPPPPSAAAVAAALSATAGGAGGDAAKRSASETEAVVDSARERYLARKKAKGN
jgi:hypothetical protein